MVSIWLWLHKSQNIYLFSSWGISWTVDNDADFWFCFKVLLWSSIIWSWWTTENQSWMWRQITRTYWWLGHLLKECEYSLYIMCFDSHLTVWSAIQGEKNDILSRNFIFILIYSNALSRNVVPLTGSQRGGHSEHTLLCCTSTHAWEFLSRVTKSGPRDCPAVCISQGNMETHLMLC